MLAQTFKIFINTKKVFVRNISDIIFEKKTVLDGVRKFDDNAKNAVWNYVAGYTVGEINKFLRTGRRLKRLDEECTLIDSMMRPIKDTILYRTVEWDYLQNIYKLNKDNLENSIGYTFEAKAYSSTTLTRQNVWASRWYDPELLLEIQVGRNTKGIYINDLFKRNEIDCYEQKEVLLQRNLKFVINDFYMMSPDGTTKSKDKSVYCINIILI